MNLERLSKIFIFYRNCFRGENMKKALSLTAIALSAVILFAGCSFGRSEIKSADDRSSESKSEEFEEMMKKYRPPAEAFGIDMNKEDPSNDDIKFEFDDKGRILNCFYTVNGMEVLTTYDYEFYENKVWILSFAQDSTVIADEKFEIDNESDDIGFSECRGYYFTKVSVV